MKDLFKDRVRPCLERIKPYQPGKPIEDVERELGIKDVIKMASNENPIGPSPLGLEALVEGAKGVHIYPDGNCLKLKEKIAAKFNLPIDHIIVGNGSDEIIKFLAEALIGEGDNAVVASPSFSEYDFAVTLMGGDLKSVDLRGDFVHDLEAMAQAVDQKTKLIFICNPNNPTGTMVDKRALDAFLDQIPDHVVVVLDEAYHDYVSAGDFPYGIDYVRQGRDNVIVLHTLSKLYGLAGLRVGYGLASPALLNWIYRVREPFNVNSLAQLAAAAALGDLDHVARSKKTNEQGRDFLYAAFDEMGLSYTPSQTNFIWFDTKKDVKVLYDKMLLEGVIIRRGDVFGYPTRMRVTIGTQAQNERFLAALKKVLA